MTNRAAAAARTADRILDATRELFVEEPLADITLAQVAAEVHAQRGDAIPDDDLADIVANLVQHYEEWGRLMITMLGEQTAAPALGDTVAAGKSYHRSWCEAVFPGALADLGGPDRFRRLAQLVAICDLRTWESLRIDPRLSRVQTAVDCGRCWPPSRRKHPDGNDSGVHLARPGASAPDLCVADRAAPTRSPDRAAHVGRRRARSE